MNGIGAYLKNTSLTFRVLSGLALGILMGLFRSTSEMRQLAALGVYIERWDAVDSDAGMDVMQGMESNFNDAPYELAFEANTLDHYGVDDFGGMGF